VLRDATAALFTCERERQLARQSFWLYQAKERTIAYGTAAPPGEAAQQREQFLQLWPQLRGQRLLLFLGRIHPKKGVDLLIEAFAAVERLNPTLQLVLAGAPISWAGELGVGDRLHWLGMVSGELKLCAFHAAELFCLPSHQKNFGIALAEALACGARSDGQTRPGPVCSTV
jgi:glycosyltransferase involved in cell wall biosynthesis